MRFSPGKWGVGSIAALSCLAVVFTAVEAQAVMIPYNSYIQPGATMPLQNTAGGVCAATALMNSFVYLQNSYPSVYGPGLTTGSNPENTLAEARDELCGVIGPANNQNIWQGKLDWFNMFAPGHTVFAGMTVDNVSTWADKQFLTGLTAPTVAFLMSQIAAGEDVEIGITGGTEHELTLTGIQVGPGGAISISYIDPNCVQGTSAANPGPSTVAVTQTAAGLQFGWQNGNGLICSGASVPVTIDSAWAESLPEPPSLAILMTAIIGFVMFYRHSARAS